jgi:hypothetical protein
VQHQCGGEPADAAAGDKDFHGAYCARAVSPRN